jgi:hypothetical protein
MIADVAEATHGSERATKLVDQAALLLVNAEHADLPSHELQRVRQAYAKRFSTLPPT